MKREGRKKGRGRKGGVLCFHNFNLNFPALKQGTGNMYLESLPTTSVEIWPGCIVKIHMHTNTHTPK
jgi:hypothetical protein